MSVIERRFHDTAKALKPRQELKASRYWVGVLYPDKKPTDQLTEIDFLWIKATGVSLDTCLRSPFFFGFFFSAPSSFYFMTTPLRQILLNHRKSPSKPYTSKSRTR